MPSEDPATWERYEALRDRIIPGVDEDERSHEHKAELDAFVRGLLTKPAQAEGGDECKTT